MSNAVMEELKGLNLPAYEYLSKVDPATWCRGWFNTYAKCDLLHNNLAECFNSWITKFRDKTILVMLEGIKTSLMRRYQRKREIIAAMEGNLGPKIKEKLEIEEDEAGHCTPTFAGDGLFEVECRGRRYAVNLPVKTCGCRKWDVSGIPCAHAISSIWHGGGNPEDYLSPYFGKEMYLKAYTPIIYPVPSEEQWARTNQPIIEPPKARASSGRPKKLRNRGADETLNPYTVRKGGTKNQCRMCKKYGHNTRTCTARMRHDERQERRRNFYRKHAADLDCNLDRVSVSCVIFMIANLYVIQCCLLTSLFDFVCSWMVHPVPHLWPNLLHQCQVPHPVPHPAPHVLVILLTQQEVGGKRGEEKMVQAVRLDKVREGVQAVHLHKVEVKGAQEEGVQAVKGKDKVRVKALQLHKVEGKIRQEEGVKAVQLLHKVEVKGAQEEGVQAVRVKALLLHKVGGKRAISGWPPGQEYLAG
jgi:hypothetical protein